MKKTLLFGCLLLASLSFGQKKLIGQAYVFYDETNNIQSIDSTHFAYTSWQGSMSELKPKFVYAGDIIGYFLDDFIVHCNSQDIYNGSSQPLTYNYTISNTLTNGLVTEANTSGTYRTLYQYNALGNVTMVVNQFMGTSAWETQDSSSTTYDGLGNKLTYAQYQTNPTTEMYWTDTFTYAPGTNRLVDAKSYYLDFLSSTLILGQRSIITYIVNNVNTIALYYDDGAGNLEYTYKFNYSYSGANCTGFTAYEVMNNIPSTTVFATGTFAFNGQNLPSEYSLDIQGDNIGKILYSYDSDGFLSSEDNYTPDANDVLYKYFSRKYYFQNTVGLNEEMDMSISLFPNPTSNILNVQTDGILESLEVVNLSGQIVVQQNSKTIDLSHLPSGNYIVRGTTSEGNFSKKIVKL